MITSILVHTMILDGSIRADFYRDDDDTPSEHKNITRSSAKRLEKIFRQKNGRIRIYIYPHSVDLFYSPV
jgi:hypothetical protein